MTDGLRGKTDRRTLVAGAMASTLLITHTGRAFASETATPMASPAEDYRLLPLSPEELGAPAVPEATVSTESDAMTLEDAVKPYMETYGTDAAPGVFPRTIRSAAGETTLEAKPERVICLELGSIDSLYKLGIKPVGIVDSTPLALAPELEAFLEDVPRIATWNEADIEAMIAAKPDLIFADASREEPFADIAPTIQLYRAGSGMVWREVFMMVALAVGEEAKGAEVVQDYENEVRALNAKLPTPRPTVSFIRVQGDSLRYMLRSNFAGRIMTDLGIPRPGQAECRRLRADRNVAGNARGIRRCGHDRGRDGRW
ncbi:MAG: ABC transporter substrate-binding protein [Thermomicrobiales bacterium]